MARRIKITACVLLGVMCLPTFLPAPTSTFRQAVNGYTGTADTYIRVDQPTNRFGSATNVLVDNDNPIAHGLLRFDDMFGNGPGQIPPNTAYIYSARLIIRTSNDGDAVWFHRMRVPWQETNNWDELSTSGPGLQADDVEMSATPDFSFTASMPVPRVDSFDVTATVQGWHSGAFPNYGWGMTNQIANGWHFDSSEHGTVTNRPVLEISYDIGDPPPRITRQPASSTNAEGSSVILSVEVEGIDPSYQWFKDGVPINAATNSTYAISVVRRIDEGSYHVYVSNPLGETTSNPAILTVIPDEAGPSLLCAYGTNNMLTIFVVFSEIVTNGGDAVNYTMLPAGGGDALAITRAVHSGGGNEGTVVVLTLDGSTPLQPDTAYDLTAHAIVDRFGNESPPQQTAVALYSQRIFAISESQIWRFNDSGNDLSNSWKNVDFDDNGWNSGLALFGFETAPLPEPLRTPLSLTDGIGGRIRTYYFRTHFSYNGPAGNGVLRFRTVLDDAAAVYINGAEVFRIRLPAGPLSYMTEGTGASVNNAVYEGPFTVCATNLANGDNLLAAEVHQTGANSGDVVWGLELFRVSAQPPPQLKIALTNSTHAVLTWLGSAMLEQNSAITDTNGWRDIEGAVSGHTVPLEGSRFFRLREP
jgi:hypothetical protein